jgi:hypothetical protein
MCRRPARGDSVTRIPPRRSVSLQETRCQPVRGLIHLFTESSSVPRCGRATWQLTRTRPQREPGGRRAGVIRLTVARPERWAGENLPSRHHQGRHVRRRSSTTAKGPGILNAVEYGRLVFEDRRPGTPAEAARCTGGGPDRVAQGAKYRLRLTSGARPQIVQGTHPQPSDVSR